MNQEMIGDLPEIEQLSTSEQKEEEKKKEDLGNPFHIEASDREIQKAFREALIALLKAKKDLSTDTHERVAGQPFHLASSKHDALEFVKAVVQMEAAFVRLTMSVTCSPTVANPSKNVVTEYTINDLRDILGLLNFTSFVRKTHNAHLDQIAQLTNQLLNSSEARFEIAQQALVDQIKCEKHPDRQAVGKNISTNKPQCAECLSGGQ